MSDRLSKLRPALQELATFPLLDALYGRRSRRFGLGMTIPDGPLAFQSKREPKPLSKLERSVIIAAGAGLSGWNLGIPYTAASRQGFGCNYTVRPIGRTFPSGAATQGSELLVTDDSGSYITRFRDLDPEAIREYQGLDDLERLIAIVDANLVRISDKRVELPRDYPYIAAHNRWVANTPGSTLFLPVGDAVESLFNQLWIRSGEGVLIYDPRLKRPLGNPEALLSRGLLRQDRRMPLPVLEGSSRNSVVTELSVAAYNIHLLLQAIGLGGWLFSGLNVNALLGLHRDQGIPGFGFRFENREDWIQPNPVGLDGLFEPLIPPYQQDMRRAAEGFAQRKFGANGNHQPWRSGPYRDNVGVKARIERFDEVFVEYLGSIAQDIYDNYGKFPASQPSVAITCYTQAHHIDLDFYDTHYGEGAYLDTHARHEQLWDVEV